MPRAYGTTNAAPYAAAPAVGAAGDTYFNTTSKLMYLSDGTSWIAVSAGAGSGVFDGFTRTHASSTGATDTTFALSASAYTDIPLALAIDVQGSTYTPNGTNTRFSIPADGVYDISAHISAAAAGWPAASGLWWSITVNGLILDRVYTNGGQAFESSSIALQRYLRAGDQVGVTVFTGTATTVRIVGAGGAYGVTSDARQPWLSVWRAGTGPKGDVGPSGPAGPAGYFYGNATAMSVGGGTLTGITWNSQGIINGFTPATAGVGSQLTAQIAGRYKVDTQIVCTSGLASLYLVIRLEHYNSLNSLLAQRDTVGSGHAVNGYGECAASGVFDMAVGDYIRVVFNPNTADTLEARSWVEITPVGGAKGDTGPDITQQQSSYWFGTISTPAAGAVLGADVQTSIGWTTTRTIGFTLASSNQRITPPATGRYQVTAEMAYAVGANASTFSRAVIFHYNSAGVEQSRVNGLGAGATGNAYAFASADGVFSVVAGDYFVVQGAINSSTGSFSNNVFCSVVPVGGTQGPIGLPGPTGDAGSPGVAEHAPTWIALTLGSGWTNYGPSFQTARVTRKHGVVFVEGLIVAAAGAVGAPITLPLGYRPAGGLIFYNHSQAGASGSTRMDVQTDGSLTVGPVPTQYASIVCSFVADPATGVEYGYDAPTMGVVNASTVSFSLPAGIAWEAGVRTSRALRASAALPMTINQYGWLSTNNQGGGYTSLANALTAAYANRSASSIPLWLIQRDASSNFILTDIREWF